MKHQHTFSAVGLSVVSMCLPANGARYYVKPSGTGSCASWADACSLTTAIALAEAPSSSGDEIWVQQGAYAGTIYIESPLDGDKFIGGFVGTETLASQSNPSANLTAFSGSGATTALDVAGSTGVLFRGFTITDGFAEEGGGARMYGSVTTFVNCVFRDNLASNFGAAVSVRSSPYIQSNVQFINCKFFDNGDDNGTVEEPVDDIPYGGAAAFIFDRSSVTFTNCLFYNNIAWEGGAIVKATLAPLTITNCTFVGNHATAGSGGAVLLGGPAQIGNSILWQNVARDSGDQISAGNVGSLSVTYSDVEGGWPGTGNIASAPLFLDAPNGNYDISGCSPCVNVGSNSLLPLDLGDLDWDTYTTTEIIPKDLNLDNRKIGGGVPTKVDMGAYEGPAQCIE